MQQDCFESLDLVPAYRESQDRPARGHRYKLLSVH